VYIIVIYRQPGALHISWYTVYHRSGGGGGSLCLVRGDTIVFRGSILPLRGGYINPMGLWHEPSVCRLSVTLVLHATHRVEIFGNILHHLIAISILRIIVLLRDKKNSTVSVRLHVTFLRSIGTALHRSLVQQQKASSSSVSERPHDMRVGR